jgi:membrane-bound inhibitor of C-type lysozyme
MKNINVYLACAFSLATFSSVAAAEKTTLESVSYSCTNNAVMRVVYVNGADGKSFAILQQMDEMIPMAEQRSASGAIYKAIDPNYTYTLITKGKDATLQDSRETLLSDCKS